MTLNGSCNWKCLNGTGLSLRGVSLLVLFPSSGSNLQALIDSTQEPSSAAHIVVVVSNRAGVAGLDRAARAGIPTRVRRLECLSAWAGF